MVAVTIFVCQFLAFFWLRNTWLVELLIESIELSLESFARVLATHLHIVRPLCCVTVISFTRLQFVITLMNNNQA